MLFDQVRELPVATVRRVPGARGVVFMGDVQRWWIARWQWLRPRTVPVLVALLGMVGVIQAVNYLSHPPPANVALEVEVGAPPTSAMVVDGTAPGPHHVRLVVRR